MSKIKIVIKNYEGKNVKRLVVSTVLEPENIFFSWRKMWIVVLSPFSFFEGKKWIVDFSRSFQGNIFKRLLFGEVEHSSSSYLELVFALQKEEEHLIIIIFATEEKVIELWEVLANFWTRDDSFFRNPSQQVIEPKTLRCVEKKSSVENTLWRDCPQLLIKLLFN